MLALFIGLLLVRTRVGLIYEVAKMNVLLGLPHGRVQRINVLSIFFLMHLLISTAGGLSAALFAFHVALPRDGPTLLLDLCADAALPCLSCCNRIVVLHDYGMRN